MKLKLLALAATALAGSASLASATTISQTQSVPFGPTEITGEAAFNYFDPTLGTLNSVTFTVSTSWENYDGSVTNTSIAPASFTFQLQTLIGPSADYDFPQNNDDQAIDALIGPIDGSGNANANQLVATDGGAIISLDDVPYGSTVDYAAATDNASATLAVAANDLGLFTTNATGTGQFDIVLESVTQQVIVGGGGNAIYNVSTSAGASLELDYNYTPNPAPVPEPASMAVLGTGLIGMARFSRRRRG